MTVFIVLHKIFHEGDAVLDVFSSRCLAVEFVEEQYPTYDPDPDDPDEWLADGECVSIREWTVKTA